MLATSGDGDGTVMSMMMVHVQSLIRTLREVMEKSCGLLVTAGAAMLVVNGQSASCI